MGESELREDVMQSLASGGRMGELMRAHDWAATPLGPVERWPQSLRTTVSTCLGSRFPILIWWGPELVKLYNDAYAEILGDKHPRALGCPGRLVWPEIWDIIGPMLAGVVERGEATWSENLMLPLERRGFAEECYFTFSYSPIRDESGGIGGVFTAVTETTDQIIGARRLRTLRELAAGTASASSVKSAWERAGAVLGAHREDLPFMALYALDPDGGQAHRVAHSGLESAAAVPATIRVDSAHAPWPLAHAMRRRSMVEAGLPAEATLVDDGTHLARRAVVLPLGRPLLQRPYGFLIAGVSARRPFDTEYRSFLQLVGDQITAAIGNAGALEEERRRAEALAELDHAKTTFFSNVSHEFRTPLTLMLGPVADLLRGGHGPLDDAQRRQLALVHRNAVRMLRLVNSLLDFARIEGGRLEATFEPVDLPALTADLASVFRSAVERAGLTYEVICPPFEAPAHVDPHMWEKIVLNLVSNAFKFTFEGGIRVRLRRDNGYVVLEVRDTGGGIPPEELPNLFRRFHRVPAQRTRTHEGTGIGLALVQELARLHGGDVEVESQPGRGTTFRVRVPATHPDVTVRREPVAALPGASGAQAMAGEMMRWLPDSARPPDDDVLDGGLTADGADATLDTRATANAEILVADDNADMREYLRRILSRRWRVRVVPDGAAALAAAHEAVPDLVLTDVMMPVLDGFGLLQALRADPRTRHLPVMMLSARAGEESYVEGLQAGADDYLVKPFSARELVARVHSHLSLARARHALEDQRHALYELFVQAPAPVCVFGGPDLVFEMANPAYEAVVGRTRLVGRRFLEALPELAGQGFDDMLRSVQTTGEPVVGKELLVMLARPDDAAPRETFWNFVYTPLSDPADDTRRVMVFAYEVTEQVRSRRAAEESNRAKDEFLAMLGHELRNPLSPILTALQVMQLRGEDAHAGELRVIERQVQHLVGLIDDLLDVSRITRGKLEIRRMPLELDHVLTRAIEMVSPLLERRRHHLEVTLLPGVRVIGDERRLAQVFSNLLNNAAKYTEPSGNISIRARVEDEEVVVTVADDGWGIAPELMPRLFEAFVQGPVSVDRRHGGLGLGLTIVRSLVRLHGGTIVAHSAGSGRGSQFTVRLPMFARTSSETVASIELVEGRDAGAGRRVLVVDDNVDAAEVLVQALGLMGYAAEARHDGPSALARVQEQMPAAVLLDIGLPVMDGYEVASRVRELPGGAAVQLIAVTGYGQDRDRERSLAAGFDEHMVKPIRIETLLEVLEKLRLPAAPGG